MTLTILRSYVRQNVDRLLPNHSVLILLAVFYFFSATASCITAQEMQYPLAVVKAPSSETIYVADRNLPGIWKIEGGQASVYFQGSKKFRTPLNAVRCLAINSQGTLYAGDSATREIYKFDEEGNPQPLTKGLIGIPMGIVIDSKGNLFVGDLERHVVFQITPAGEVTEFVRTKAPRGIAIDKQDRVWILANTGDSLIRFQPDKSKEVIVSGTPFQFPNQIVVDEADNAYFCDGYAKAIVKISPNSQPQNLVTGEPLMNPVGITLSGKQLLIADPHKKAIYSLNIEGEAMLENVFPK
jgi:DNA-binding beta-propeller fold protein YncE